MNKFFVFALFLAVLLPGCGTRKTLGKYFNKTRNDIHYYSRFSKERNEKQKTLAVTFIDESPTSDFTEVKKVGEKLMPLIFVNNSIKTFNINYGKNGINPSLAEFHRSNLVEELNRSSLFNVIQSDSADYHLTVKLKKNNFQDIYERNETTYYLVLFYITNYKAKAQPVFREMVCEAEFTDRQGSVIFSKQYESIGSVKFPLEKIRYSYLLPSMVKNYADNVQMTSNDILNRIVGDIRKFAPTGNSN